MNEPRIPERQGLELGFVRARWLAAVALAILRPLGGYSAAETVVLVAAVISGNVAVWRRALRVQSLAGQRRLGVAAVAMDALVVFGAGLETPTHPDHANTASIIAKLEAGGADVEVYGYIEIGQLGATPPTAAGFPSLIHI